VVPEREGATTKGAEEAATDNMDGITWGCVDKDISLGFAKNDDGCTGVEEEFDGSPSVGFETKTEEAWGVRKLDYLPMDEGAAVARGAVNLQDCTVGAEDKWFVAQDRGEAVIAEACLGEDIFVVAWEYDGGCVEGIGRGMSGGCWRESCDGCRRGWE